MRDEGAVVALLDAVRACTNAFGRACTASGHGKGLHPAVVGGGNENGTDKQASRGTGGENGHASEVAMIALTSGACAVSSLHARSMVLTSDATALQRSGLESLEFERPEAAAGAIPPYPPLAQ